MCGRGFTGGIPCCPRFPLLTSWAAMRTLRLLAAVVLLAATFAQAQNPPKPATADPVKPSEYATLVARAKAGDKNVDFLRMRLAYMESPERRQARDISNEEEAMIAAINTRDFEAALKNANVVLANQYINMDGHFAAYIAHRELHQDDQAAIHRTTFRSLLSSIIDSGDGRSPKTAWVVINVHEEYVVLRVLGLTASKQSVTHEGERAFDVMECKDGKSGEMVTVYFDVTIPMKHYLQ